MNREPLLQFFQYRHLPEKLQIISKPFCDLASQIIENVPANIERSQALRKLLESKDCAVRAALFNDCPYNRPASSDSFPAVPVQHHEMSREEVIERLAYDPETNVRA